MPRASTAQVREPVWTAVGAAIHFPGCGARCGPFFQPQLASSVRSGAQDWVSGLGVFGAQAGLALEIVPKTMNIKSQKEMNDCDGTIGDSPHTTLTGADTAPGAREHPGAGTNGMSLTAVMLSPGSGTAEPGTEEKPASHRR
ncbi:hypothetical protein NDU88_001578 [Pleurodeles waltl]|uniref:Uncharacterized protein n=1 Tax=Pleurodeles waltl TaxID=8319 RepID=A0AAV7MQA5_PLEWA|nr:hypothetical protein NDU88_001578 [Pleurodeles waltl]